MGVYRNTKERKLDDDDDDESNHSIQSILYFLSFVNYIWMVPWGEGRGRGNVHFPTQHYSSGGQTDELRDNRLNQSGDKNTK